MSEYYFLEKLPSRSLPSTMSQLYGGELKIKSVHEMWTPVLSLGLVYLVKCRLQEFNNEKVAFF